MRRLTLLNLSTVSLGALALAFTTPAAAQDQVTNAPDPECANVPEGDARDRCISGEVELESGQAATTKDEIIVTGSRIRRPTLTSNVPITSVGPEELLNDSTVALGDALNDLPALRSTFGSSNSQRFIGTTGLSLLDLRGLGTTRTLVLVNGRRHVTASAGDFRVDVNTIPFELLDRVDVVTGGNSAVYGSDAIAGVVNFILKRDFEGFTARAQSSVSSRGDRGAYFVSALGGRNFADDRGNITLTAEYSKSNEVSNLQRPAQSGALFGFTGFIQTDVDAPGEVDGIIDNTLQNNVRYNFISEGGTLTTFCLGNPVRQPLACEANGQQRFFRFDQNGRLQVGETPTRDFRLDVRGSSFAIGGDGSTLSDYGTLFPDIERVSVNLLTHFDISEALKPFIEAKFARLKTFSESSPSFTNSFCGGLSGIAGLSRACDAAPGTGGRGFANSAVIAIGLDNPFLNPADATLIRNIQRELIAAAGGSPALNPTFFRVNRNNLDLGVRAEENQRDTFRVVGGIEGRFNGDWRYELSATYGKFDARLSSLNNQVVQRFRNAIDAVRAGDGSIVCRINADAVTTNDDAACVPINPFGASPGRPGAASNAALAYINTTSRYEEHATQLDVLGYVNGDSSQLFELPGGPIRFSVGGEYRREKSRIEVDELTRTRQTFLTALTEFNPPTLTVSEVFGELQVPLLRERPFFHELELQGAARYSDYNRGAGNTNKVFTYNVGATWAPVRDLRFRGNYSKAVRAPTPGDLFSAQGQNFAFLTDPCDRRNIGAGPPQRVTNCRSATRLGNVPVDYIQQSGNRSILQGGNPELMEETSKGLTVGAIFQPRFVSGLSFTVDYYDIDVKNVISSLSGNVILSQCYDSANFPDNAFCQLVGDREPGGLLNSSAAVTVTALNFARLVARGIDFDLAFRRTLANGDKLSLRGIATVNIERTNYLDALNPDVPNRVRSELGDPHLAANFNASYKRGIATLGYALRYIGRQTIGTYETQNSFNGNPPLNPDAFRRVYYPDAFYHDVRLDLTPVERFNFYLGVDNVGDKLPPLGLTGAGAGSGIFDNVGRVFYAGAKVKF